MAAEQQSALTKQKDNSNLGKEIVASVQNRIAELTEENQLNLPKNYSAANALQSAILAIQETKDISGQNALTVCSKTSIYNALFNTVVQGLSPAKKQVYYIVYGDQLQASRSYFGTMAVTKRLNDVQDIYADVVYKGDTFKTSKKNGSWVVNAHESSYENIDNDNIVAAYCTIVRKDGSAYTEIMNMKQIQTSWNKGKTKGAVHKEFPDQMAKRTVINRACKYFANTSDDSDLIIDAFNRTGEHQIHDEPAADTTQDSGQLEELNAEMATILAAKKAEKARAIDIPEAEISKEEKGCKQGQPEKTDSKEAAEHEAEQFRLNG